jgi:hypothetical protein
MVLIALLDTPVPSFSSPIVNVHHAEKARADRMPGWYLISISLGEMRQQCEKRCNLATPIG